MELGNAEMISHPFKKFYSKSDDDEKCHLIMISIVTSNREGKGGCNPDENAHQPNLKRESVMSQSIFNFTESKMLSDQKK